MKILYSHRTRSTDGQYVHIASLTSALAALGHDVLMCGPEGITKPDQDRRLLNAGNGKAGGLKTWPFGVYEWAELGYSVPAYLKLQSAARQFRPDIIYERYNIYHHAGARLSKRLGLPLMLEVNAPLADERFQNGELKLKWLGDWSEGSVWRSADAVLPVTQVLGDIITAKGVAPEKVHVIPNGVEDETLTLASPETVRKRYGLNNSTVLGFVGFVRDWHGVDRVVDWLATPSGKGAVLMIVGDGPAIPSLKEQANRYGLTDRVIVTGVVQREAVAEHVAAFDIALQPAVTAYASPLKLQEYMAQGKAIIAPDQPNIRETVADGDSAILVPPNNREALFTALSRLTMDTDLRDSLGRKARQTVIDRDMTWKGNARRVVAIAEALKAQSA